MKRHTIKRKNIALFTLLFVFLMSIWCVDVSITTLNLGLMTNGFFNMTPDKTYHLGLYTAMISFIIVCFMSIE